MPLDYELTDAARSLDNQQLLDWQNGWQVVDPAGGSNLVTEGTGDHEFDVAAGEVNLGGTVSDPGAGSVDFSADVDADEDRMALIYRDANGALQKALGATGDREPAGQTPRETYHPPPPTLSGTDGVVLAEVLIPAGASSLGSDELRDRRIPAKLFLNALDAKEITAEDTDTNEINDAIYADNYDSLQAAIDAVPTPAGNSRALKKVIIPGVDGGYSETFDMSSHIGLNVEMTGGTEPHIEGSGDHTINVTRQDCTIRGGWVDQTDDSGNFDAIHGDAPELIILDVDVDFAPRYGIYITGQTRPYIGGGTQIKGGDTAALRIDANGALLDLLIKDCPAIGADIRGDFASGVLMVRGTTSGTGLVTGPSSQRHSLVGIIDSPGDRGMFIDSQEGTFVFTVYNPTSHAIQVGDGTDNYFFGHYGGSVKFGSSATDNVVQATGITSVTDDGTRNVVNGRVTSPETLGLGGTDGTVSPTVLPAGVVPFFVDAGGSATELEGIDGSLRREGQTVRVIHTGGENVTLVNNDTAENGTLINKSGGNVVLGTNGDMAEYTWSTAASKWIGGEVATQ